MTLNVAACVERIRALQEPSGRIPWIETGIWDPWSQAECAAALAAAGQLKPATQALDHLAETQRDDGAWDADLGCAAPMDADNRMLIAGAAPKVVDTNFCGWGTPERRWANTTAPTQPCA